MTAVLEALECRRLLAASLVKDINDATFDAEPGNFTDVNGTLYFSATWSDHALFKSDGTAAGTLPVTSAALPSFGSPENLTNVGGTLFFTARNFGSGRELWKSDGTPAGTGMVKDITAGSGDSGFYNLVDIGGLCYFTRSAATGSELWRSDGTNAGTQMLAALPAPGHSVGRVVEANGKLFFPVYSGPAGSEMWVSDGTQAGTHVLKDINPSTSGSISIGPAYNLDGTIFFRASDGTTGQELWTTDGTEAGTHLFKDLNPGLADSTPHGFVKVNGTWLFLATDATGGRELWKTDLTPDGTVRVKDLQPGTSWGAAETILYSLGDIGMFFARDASGVDKLWRTDGTADGTYVVANNMPTTLVTSTVPAAADGKFYFITAGGATGTRAVWRSDGTADGTIQVSGNLFGLGWLTAFGDRVVFYGREAQYGAEPWITDGTPAGTHLLKDINDNSHSSSPLYTTTMNGVAYFRAGSPQYGIELWRSDGTADGTHVVKDVFAGPESSNNLWAWPLAAAGDALFFVADDGTGKGRELWTSDGSEAGTRLVREINPGPAPAEIYNLYAFDDEVYFTASDGVHGFELWKSDGTSDGTVMIKDINPGSQWGQPKGFVRMGGVIYFSAHGAGAGEELWRTDGTEAGTYLVREIGPGTAGGIRTFNWQDTPIEVAGDRLYFIADDGIHGQELWRSDGTAAGTEMVADLPSVGSPHVTDVTNVNGTIFFTRTGGPVELWKSDGTVIGTVKVKNVGGNIGVDTPMAVLNGLLFFIGEDRGATGAPPDAQQGYELWRSDGTDAGTYPMKEFKVLSGGYSMSGLQVAGGYVWFTAPDVRGPMVWRTDGTAAGLAAVAPGGFDFSLHAPSVGELADHFVFAGSDPRHRIELWSIEKAPQLVADAGADYIVNEPSSVTLSAAGSTAPPGRTIVGYEWDLNYNGTTFDVDHGAATYTEFFPDGPYRRTVAVRVTDDLGNTAIDTADIIIRNVRRTVTATGPSVIAPGATYTLNLSESDPGPDTVTQWNINWGDGTGWQVFAGNPSSITHVYTDGGNYTIQATVSDEDSGYSAAPVSVTVTNNAPVLGTITHAETVNEGGKFNLGGTFSDVDSTNKHTVTIVWGDGTADTVLNLAAGVTSFSTSHVYADDNPTGTPQDDYPITITLADTVASDVESRMVTVRNVAPTANAGADRTVNEGAQVSFNGVRTDSSAADTYSYLWEVRTAAGALLASATTQNFTYAAADDGAYVVSFRVADDDGGAHTDTANLTVNNTAPVLTIAASGSSIVNEGSPFTLLLSRSDPGADTITSWSINWGDGTVQQVSGNPSQVQHVYANGPAGYTVSATATDEDGTWASNVLGLSGGGSLVTSFGSSGRVTPPSLRDIAVQTDGKIVAVASATSNTNPAFVVYRYNANGSIDTTFNGTGANGTMPAAWALATGVAVAPDGRIVVSGYYRIADQSFRWVVARYLSNGQLDPSFGTGGFAFPNLGDGFYCEAWDVAVQPDGKILVGGNIDFGDGSYYDQVVLRFDTDGSLDDTFGAGGVSTRVDYNEIGNRAFALLLQPDGRILLGGETGGGNQSSQFTLVRYSANGALDSTFSGDGVAFAATPGGYAGVRGLALQPDGRILAAGNSGSNFTSSDSVIARFTAGGQLDTSWDGDGLLIANWSTVDAATSVAVQPDGKILVGGYGLSGRDWILSRYQPNGALDTGFGFSGRATLNFRTAFETISTIIFQRDFTILAGGDGGIAKFSAGNPGVRINNVAASFNAGPDVAFAPGETFARSGFFTDPGADTWTATINYGDGGGVQPLTLGPGKTWSLEHVYANSGNYGLTMTINDGTTTTTDFVFVSVGLPAGWSAAPGTVYSVTGPAGAQTLNVSAGTLTLNADAAQRYPGIALHVTGGQVVFNAGQTFYGMILEGGGIATLTPGAVGGNFVATRGLQISADSKFGLGDGMLLVDYTGASPHGTWTGSDYSGLTGLLRRGYNGGTWNGTGGITSTPAGAADASTALAIAEASNLLSFGAAQTASWNGRTVDATTVLIRSTYGGDANLDGKINIDDYGRIDSNVGSGATGWFNGDFNYDGKINIDDYGIIDSNIGTQNASLAAASDTAEAAIDSHIGAQGASLAATSDTAEAAPAPAKAFLMKRPPYMLPATWSQVPLGWTDDDDWWNRDSAAEDHVAGRR